MPSVERLRPALLAVLPAIVVAANWRRLEDPRGSGTDVFLVVVLALAPVLVPRLAARLVVAAVAGLLTLAVAFDRSPLDARPFSDRDFFGPIWRDFRTGFLGFYDLTLPLDAGRHPRMHGVIVLAIFGFVLAIALGVAAKRPVPAVLAVVAGAGWPATLLTGGPELLRGGFILASALLLLAGLSDRGTGMLARALPAIGVLLLAAMAAGTSPAVAKSEFLDWQRWDFYDRPQKPVSVSYVWNSSYAGIKFPKKATTVLRIKAAPRSLYWRATTLDVYDGRGWIEDLERLLPPRGAALPQVDPLLPARARDPRNWLEQVVTVGALRDAHLVGGSVPVGYRYDVGSLGQVLYATNGVAITPRGLQRDDRYTVVSFAPQPKPDALAGSKPRYPTEIRASGYLDVAPGVTFPRFGAPNREQQVQR